MNPEYGRRYATLYHNHYWWRARERVVTKQIEALVTSPPIDILDFGCGDGLLSPVLERFGKVRGVELDQTLLDPNGRYRDRIATRPLAEVAQGKQRYDLIVALDVLEHIEDDYACLADIATLLRCGGFLLATVPAHKFLWSKHDGINAHCRRYERQEIVKLVQSRLEVLTTRFLFHSLVAPRWLLARLERSGHSLKSLAAAETSIPPAAVNRFLTAALVAEATWLSALQLPVGTSLIITARKATA